jgi:pyrimidine operon attenuation protein/uracil phosphoribosyltransferase
LFIEIITTIVVYYYISSLQLHDFCFNLPSIFLKKLKKADYKLFYSNKPNYIYILMGKVRTILADKRFDLTVQRLTHELIENYGDFSNTCLIGIQERGVILSERIKSQLEKEDFELTHYGKLDITFYRDDFRTRKDPIKASKTELEFLIEGKKVILVDDVLYTGRTVQSALAALQDFGRPAQVEFLCLVDRRFNRHLPIQADYVGLTVDALDEAYVKVEWVHLHKRDRIVLYSAK